jgi:23S rRNA (uridine2552-2'-O)-methyltransferase
MGRSKSSQRWLREHFDDSWVQLAQKEGYRSRSVYKLLEINEKHRLLKKGMLVVDLGAAPGGWCQAISRELAGNCRILAVDLLPMEPLPEVSFIEGDFTEDGPLAELETLLAGRSADLVLSDMAPNMSGVSAIDQPRSMYLAELALDFCEKHLKPGGDFLVKVFQGQGFDEFLAAVRGGFDKVSICKPAASRPRSREVYMLARSRKLQ